MSPFARTVPYEALELRAHVVQLTEWRDAVASCRGSRKALSLQVTDCASPFNAGPDPALLPLAARLELSMYLEDLQD